jgi:hypothetical protein
MCIATSMPNRAEAHNATIETAAPESEDIMPMQYAMIALQTTPNYSCSCPSYKTSNSILLIFTPP